MEWLLLFGFIATICTSTVFSVPQYEGSSESVSWGCLNANGKRTNKVKILKADILEANKEYYVNGRYKTGIVKVNETYNRLTVEYEYKKDYPDDLKLQVQILRSNSLNGCYEKIHEYYLFMCKDTNNKYFKYLTNNEGEELTKGTCPKKGLSVSDCDANYFRFYDILSEEELQQAPYFKAISTSRHGKEIIFSTERTFESNCKRH